MSQFVSIPDLVRRIHASPTRIVLAVTGGGSPAIADLLTTPGGSQTLLDAVVPYSSGALAAYLGFAPRQACSAETAGRMAVRAYELAVGLCPESESAGDVAGVACTAGLVSTREKRGEHRLHVAVHSASLTAVESLELTKGARDRPQEERLAADLILNQIARAAGLDARLEPSLLPGERVETEAIEPPADWRRLAAGELPWACEGPRRASWPAVFPGAFHPLHEGHRGLARTAAARLGTPPAFEISIRNVDKPGMDWLDMRQRAAQFTADDSLLFTQAATFAEKAALFPGAVFVVGADTIDRIGRLKYYDHCRAERDEAIAEIAAAGCRFLVFGRLMEGRFLRLRDLPLESDLQSLCEEVPPEEFRLDICSTAMRERE